MFIQPLKSKYISQLKRITSKENATNRLKFILETMQKHFSKEAYDDISEIINSLGLPVRVFDPTDGGADQQDAFGLRFKKGFSVSLFNWGPGDAEKILKENPIDEEGLSDDEVGPYLEGTKLHAFYSTSIDFVEKHKTLSHVIANKTHCESKGCDLDDMLSRRFPCVDQRLICLCYIGPMWAISITKNQSKRFR